MKAFLNSFIAFSFLILSFSGLHSHTIVNEGLAYQAHEHNSHCGETAIACQIIHKVQSNTKFFSKHFTFSPVQKSFKAERFCQVFAKKLTPLHLSPSRAPPLV